MSCKNCQSPNGKDKVQSVALCTENNAINLHLGVFRHIQDRPSRENSMVILKAFQKNLDVKKRYGPDVSIQYIRCLGELAAVCT
jgi:hypothetical protein